MITANGEAFPTTARCGFLLGFLRTGLPTEMDIGPGLRRGAGLGLKMNRGASRPSTMADGPMSEEAGAGCRVLLLCGPSMLLRSSHSLEDRASAWAFRSEEAVAEWRGSRWDRAKFTFRPTAPARATYRMSM